MRTASLLLLLLLSACAYRVEKEGADSVKLNPDSLGFPEVQAAIFGPKCARCHGWAGSYEGVTANLAEISARTQSADPNFMMPPPNATALTAEEKSSLAAWIAKGAPRVGGGEPGQPSVPPPAPPAPTPPPVVPGPISPVLSYNNVRDSVLVPKCARCHSQMVNNYDSVVANLTEINSRVRSEFDFDQMPPARAAQLTVEEKNLLLDWIAAGAPLNSTAPSPPGQPLPPAPPPTKPPGCDDDDHDDDHLTPNNRRGGDDDCHVT